MQNTDQDMPSTRQYFGLNLKSLYEDQLLLPEIKNVHFRKWLIADASSDMEPEINFDEERKLQP